MGVRSFVGAHLGGGSSSFSTEVIAPINSQGASIAVADESLNQFKIAVAGDFDRPGMGNGSTAGTSRTTSVRVNGAAAVSWVVANGVSGPQVDSTGSAGAAAVVIGDLVTLSRSSTGSGSYNGNWANFVSPTTAVTLLLASGFANFTSTGARLVPISGFAALFSDGDARAKTIIDVTGTISGCFITIEVNTKPNDATHELYVNDTATGVTITIPAGTTGRFEPSGTLTASINAGENAYWRQTSTGSGSLTYIAFGCTLQATSGEKSVVIARAGAGASRTGSATVHYPPIVARLLHTNTTEANATVKIGFAARLSNLSVLTGTAGYDTVFTVRVNGVDTGLTVTQPSGSSGWVTGGTPITVTATDDVSLSWAGGTSGTTQGLAVVITVEDVEGRLVGVADGLSTVSGVFAASATATASATGAGAASGVFAATATMTGTAAGVGTATADFSPPAIMVAEAAGAASATAVFSSIAVMTGTAAGTSQASAVTNGTPVAVASRRLRNRVVTVELTAAINGDGLTETFYLSTDRFSTVAADTPAHRSFHPSLMDPGSIGLNAYSSGRVSGSTKLEVGEVVVANRNGQFDSWLGHSFAGRPVVIRVGRYTGYPANFTTVLTCTADAVEAGLDTVIIRLRDRQYLFSVPAAQARYGGTNALPNGVDGTSSDLKGRVKPLVYGDVTNITPAFVNTTLLVYQVASNPIASINGVYDKGAPKTFTADYATVDQLLGATLSGSEYATCLTAGLFRLGTSPLGQVTADVSEGATAADRTTAQVLKRLALAAGLTSGEVSAADVIAMDAAAPGPVGIFVADESPFSNVMDRVAASVGAYYGFDAEGVLRLGVLVAPTGSYALSLTPDQILDGVAIKPVAGLTSPVWSVTVNHSPVWTTQATDLAGSVDDDRRAFLALPSRGTTATDAAVRTKHLLAGEMLVDSLIASEAYANAEAARLLDLFKTPRIVLDVPVHLSVLEGMSNIIRIGQEVLVTMPRYGFDDGRSLVCIGLRIELAANRAILTLWG